MYYPILTLYLIIHHIAGLEIISSNASKYCFHFSWLGPTFDDETKINCTSMEKMKIPCTKPIEISLTQPNITDIWMNRDRAQYTCLLQPGYSCIKYTYSFNQAILNITHFCGKMIENKMTAINSGCYTQILEGHIVEACACKSTGFGDGMPCNSSNKNFHSLLSILVTSVICILEIFHVFRFS